jgi:hypothetical protein
MLVRWLLFETWLGERLLAILERKAGLAVVQSDWLGGQPSAKPHAASGE